jgi:hypothetical protein
LAQNICTYAKIKWQHPTKKKAADAKIKFAHNPAPPPR